MVLALLPACFADHIHHPIPAMSTTATEIIAQGIDRFLTGLRGVEEGDGAIPTGGAEVVVAITAGSFESDIDEK
jgi:hypothetical protein